MSHTETLKKAVSQHQNGEFENAAQLYRQVLAAEPDNADALHMLGLLSYQAGQAGRAVDLISRSLAINPDFPPAIMNLGNALLAMQDHAKAEEIFRRALAVQDPQTGAMLGLAICLCGKKDTTRRSSGLTASWKPNLKTHWRCTKWRSHTERSKNFPRPANTCRKRST